MSPQRLANCLLACALVTPVVAWPTPDDIGNVSISSLFGRDDNFDVENFDDLSFITRMAAIGDSYSAGIGAGHLLGGIDEFYCRRYDHAYPYLINEDERLGDPSKRKFQFESCSGAVVQDIQHKQIPSIDSDQQIILLSAGGNDAELVDILNQCIFQWWAITEWQQTVGKIAEMLQQPWASWFDWEKGARGCQTQLEISRDIIEGDEFNGRLDDMLEYAKKKLSSDGMIYYTGYAKFFSTDYGSACDKVTWSTWSKTLLNVWEPAARLTRSRRRDMNDLVDLMNEKLEAAVERAGSKVKFVDYDQFVGRLKGRYCEDGVDESDVESTTRPALMFYSMNSHDPWGQNPFKRGVETHGLSTFGGSMNSMVQAVDFLSNGAAEYRHEHLIEVAEDAEDDSVSANNLISDLVGWIPIPNLLPDGYGRVFHPQVFLHKIIADLVIFHISNRRLEENGHEALPLIQDDGGSCPLEPSPDDEDEEEEDKGPTLDTPDVSENKKKCYNGGIKSPYGLIEKAAENFCKNKLEKHDEGPVFSNFKTTHHNRSPPLGHFVIKFEVFDGCEWEYSFDECMRYFRVPIDSCNCRQKGDKQGGTVRNNCIYARIDPNTG